MRPMKTAKYPVEWQASHTPFETLINYCLRGRDNPVLQSCQAGDHIADLCTLLHDDIDEDLWSGSNAAVGSQARQLLDDLANQVSRNADKHAASLLYSIATQAAFEVLGLYLRHRELFDQIGPRRKLLPCLLSVHPRTEQITARMRRDACLGDQTDDARKVGSKAWFLSDTSANVYARAIIASVEFNQQLVPIEKQQKSWKAYDRKYHVHTRMLPFPQYVIGLEVLPVPITPASVLVYWRKGKQIILEEIPEFHERPEWAEYRDRRRYANGAKKGSVQHAIFKDILTALKTISGSNKRPFKERRQRPGVFG